MEKGSFEESFKGCMEQLDLWEETPCKRKSLIKEMELFQGAEIPWIAENDNKNLKCSTVY